MVAGKGANSIWEEFLWTGKCILTGILIVCQANSQQAISKKSRSIINDPTHPLHSCFEIMPSGKRYRTPAFKRQLFNKSFIPSAVRFLNSQKNFMMSSIPVIYLLPNYNFQAISTKLIHFDVSINLLRSIYFPDSSLSRLNKFYHQSAICL